MATNFNYKTYAPKQNLFKRERNLLTGSPAIATHYTLLDPTMFTNIKVVKNGNTSVEISTTNDIGTPDADGLFDLETAIYGDPVDISADDYFKGDSRGLSAVKVEITGVEAKEVDIMINQYVRS